MKYVSRDERDRIAQWLKCRFEINDPGDVAWIASPKQMQLHNTYTIYCPYILRKRLLVQLQTGKHDSYRTMIKGAGVKSQLLHYD